MQKIKIGHRAGHHLQGKMIVQTPLKVPIENCVCPGSLPPQGMADDRCIIVIKHVGFFTIWAQLTIAVTRTSLPLNLYTSVFGCGCGFGFEQKFWRIDGLGKKKARIGGFAYPYSSLWKRVIAWERSRAASGYGIIWGDADRNKQEAFRVECHRVDWF